MGTLIREYTPADREGCLEAFKSNVPQYFTEEEIADFDSFLGRLQTQSENELRTKKTYFFVVDVDGRIIGCGGFGDKDNTNIISLAWGLIHKDFHKKGFGKKLLLHRLEQINEIYPAAPVVIDTTQFSYSFFEKYGFSTTKITNDFYTAGMHRYDMIFTPKSREHSQT